MQGVPRLGHPRPSAPCASVRPFRPPLHARAHHPKIHPPQAGKNRQKKETLYMQKRDLKRKKPATSAFAASRSETRSKRSTGAFCRLSAVAPYLLSRRQERTVRKSGNSVKGFKKKKAGDYLLSRVSSIIGARGLDFRVRNGNGYCPSAMAAGKLCRVVLESISKPLRAAGTGLRRAVKEKEEKVLFNGNDNMAKPHGLLVLLG